MSDVFDLLIEQQTGPSGAQAPSEESIGQDQEIPWYRAIPADVLKGLIGGVVNFGRAFGPLPDVPGEEPYDPEKLRSFLDEQLPSSPTFIGGAARRGLEALPLATTTPGLGAARGGLAAMTGGALGEGAKEAGLGPLSQGIAEALPFVATGGAATIPEKGSKVSSILSNTKALPSRIKKFFEKKASTAEEINEVIRFGKAQGMTAQELAPLVQPDKKSTLLSKFASKGGRTQKALGRSKEAVDKIAEHFSTGEHASKTLTPDASTNLIGKISEMLHEMPSKTSSLIKDDFAKLQNSPKDVKSIVRFFRAINAQYGSDKKRLGLLKEPIREALGTIDPTLANDFNLSNKLFQRYYAISSKLKPSVASDILDYAMVPKVMYGALTGNYGVIAEALGEHGARLLSAEMLTNPRLLSLSNKMVSALNSGKVSTLDTLTREYANEVRKKDPKIADALLEASYKEFAGSDR